MLTSAFFIFYMCTAPFIGPLADRYPRRLIMAAGAAIWSGATLLTAVTYNFPSCSFATRWSESARPPSWPSRRPISRISSGASTRPRPLDFLSRHSCRNSPGILARRFARRPLRLAGAFYVGAAPGFCWLCCCSPCRSPRGSADHISGSFKRNTLRGLGKNKAFWTCSLGMAMLTFAIGGMQVWMPTFLFRMRGIPLADANRVFGLMTLASGILATLLGGWLGDFLLRFTRGAYYLVSAVGMAVTLPAIVAAVYITGEGMYPAIFVAEFFLLLNTAPMNAALVIRSRAGFAPPPSP